MPDERDIVEVLSKDIDEVLNWAYDPKNDLSVTTLEKIRLILGDDHQSEILRLNGAEVFQIIDFSNRKRSDELVTFLSSLRDTILDVRARSSSVALRSALLCVLPGVLEALEKHT
ncbi:MAG: hypothetical protein AAB345_00280 [Patescibacteria group bacterium]